MAAGCLADHALGEGKVRLRIIRMDKEGRSAFHVGLQQVHACVRGIPALHHDIIQLVAQKLIDHALVLAVDFQKVRQGSHRGNVTRLGRRTGLEDVPYRLRRIAVVANQPFEGIATPIQSRQLASKLIAAPLAVILFLAPRIDLDTHLCDLRLESLQPFRHRLKGELHLPPLQPQGLQLLPSYFGLPLEPLCLLLQPRKSRCRLCLLIARLRGALYKLQCLPAVLLRPLLGTLQRTHSLLRFTLLLLCRLS